jgi:hypothetical protein
MPHLADLEMLLTPTIEDGSVGGTAQKVGGPFDKEGVVGKQFTEGGALGATAQSTAETAQGEKPSAFDAKGMVGKQFTSQYFTLSSQLALNPVMQPRVRLGVQLRRLVARLIKKAWSESILIQMGLLVELCKRI